MRGQFHRSGLGDYRSGVRRGGAGGAIRPRAEALQILCADDSLVNLKLLSVILRRAGHEVTCVHDGLEAWAAIVASPSRFDILITDHDMPNLNGLGLVNRLRGLPFRGKIILNSATVTQDDIRAYEREAIEASVQKPVSPGRLLEVVQRCGKGRG